MILSRPWGQGFTNVNLDILRQRKAKSIDSVSVSNYLSRKFSVSINRKSEEITLLL
jgi:hypothetical protein